MSGFFSRLAAAPWRARARGVVEQGLLEGAGRGHAEAAVGEDARVGEHSKTCLLLYYSKVQVLFWVKKLQKSWSLLNLCIWYGLGECLVQGVGDGKAS